MTFERHGRAVERALGFAAAIPELRARIEAVHGGASTSGEYYDGVRGALNDALLRGRLTREREAAFREAVRAIDEMFRSTNPEVYLGQAGDGVRLALFGIAGGAIWHSALAYLVARGTPLVFDAVLGILAVMAYRAVARRRGIGVRSALVAWLPVALAAAAGSAPLEALDASSASWIALAVGAGLISGAWLYDHGNGLHWRGRAAAGFPV